MIWRTRKSFFVRSDPTSVFLCVFYVIIGGDPHRHIPTELYPGKCDRGELRCIGVIFFFSLSVRPRIRIVRFRYRTSAYSDNKTLKSAAVFNEVARTAGEQDKRVAENRRTGPRGPNPRPCASAAFHIVSEARTDRGSYFLVGT